MKKYSLWSNFKFAYGPIWKEKRGYISDMLLEIIFSVGLPLAGSALTAWIIWLLGNERKPVMVVAGILAAFLGYALANAAQTYITQKHLAHHIEVRLELFFMPVIRKQLDLSLEKSERADIRLMEEKAGMAIGSNFTGIEGFFRYGTKLGAGLVGLVVYSCIAGKIHPAILIMLFALSAGNALLRNLPQRYADQTKEQKAGYSVTMKYINRVVENVAAGKDIRVFGLTSWIIGKYDKAIREIRRLNAGKNLLEFLGTAAEITCSAVRDLICYLYLIHCLGSGMALTEFVFYLGIIGGFSGWFNQVSQNLMRVRSCSSQISDIRAFLEMGEKDDSEKQVPLNGFENIDIVFEQVSYCYEDSDKPVLEDISFHIAPGEHIALVGLNGAGKSTMAKLLSGLYLPTKGEIYINGINTKELKLQEYFKHQAAVFQDAFILAYTIAENVALGEVWEEKRVWDCLEAAGLAEKVRKLSEGLHTYLGKDLQEQGIALSGGETQKLLLARALYRNPSLILLDEPTAALDALAESEIYEIYNEALKGVTSLFISHRLASTRFCQNVLLLSEGKVIEQGSHEQLLAKKGEYFHLFQVQSKYYREEGVSNVR